MVTIRLVDAVGQQELLRLSLGPIEDATIQCCAVPMTRGVLGVVQGSLPCGDGVYPVPMAEP
jgi:hypothetical protein